MKKHFKLFYVLKVLLPIIFSVSASSIVLSIIINVLNGVLSGGTTISLQFFFNSIMNKDTEKMVYAFTITAAVMILSQVTNGALNIVIEDNTYKIRKNTTNFLNIKTGQYSPLFFEDEANLNKLEKAKEGAHTAVYFFNVICLIVAYYIPYFIFMAVYLWKLDRILSLSVVLIFIPTVLSQVMRQKYFDESSVKQAPLKRKCNHFVDCLTGIAYLKETRLLGAEDFFRGKFKKNMENYNRVRLGAIKKSNRHELKMKAITLTGYIAVLLLLVSSLMGGRISVGAFAAVFTSINTMFNTMEKLICTHVGAVSECLSDIDSYIELIDNLHKEKKEMAELTSFDIAFENVSFAYPGSDRNILEEISLHIKDKETIALVGENGAGKSTLVKLLTCMYSPGSGTIRIGGKNVEEINPNSVYSKESAVFQDFKRYSMTLRENVTISNIDNTKDERRIDSCLLDVNMSSMKNELEYGYDTVLTKEFGNIDLSGGQWQKLAIARGEFKDSKLIVLDEPTSAIDPNKERELYHMFARLVKGKTAIIVTHRLGMARLADRIVVLENGRILELGTHEELIRQNGKYTYMYHLQKEQYISP